MLDNIRGIIGIVVLIIGVIGIVGGLGIGITYQGNEYTAKVERRQKFFCGMVVVALVIGLGLIYIWPHIFK